MLDSKARKFIQPVLDIIAVGMRKANLTANIVSLLALVFGVAAGLVLVIGDLVAVSVALFWLSGLFDTLDGTIARQNKRSSLWGAVIDITFDRIVEMAIILAVLYRNPADGWVLVILMCSILLSMTIFLSVAAASNKVNGKSFYYQAGLAERSEGFIFFTLMIVLPQWLVAVTLVFSACIIFTAGQRLLEAKRVLGRY